jgi:hypothetical protein
MYTIGVGTKSLCEDMTSCFVLHASCFLFWGQKDMIGITNVRCYLNYEGERSLHRIENKS